MKSILDRIKAFLSYLFGIDKAEYFDLLDEYEDYVKGENLSCFDTMIGTVRSKEQYDINISHGFYHIPVRYVDSPEDISYIALYRSKNIFDTDEPGVKHYGRVLSYAKVKRRDINELKLSFAPDEDYYRFEVSEWKTLDFPVKAKESGPIVFLMANKFLLFNARYFYELFISDNDLYKLNLGLRDIVREVYVGFYVGEFRIRVWWNKIVVKSKATKITINVSDYIRYPYATLKKIADIVFDGVTP